MTDSTSKIQPLTYKDTGVDIDRAKEAVRLLTPHAKRTHDDCVMGGIGPFAAAVDLGAILDQMELSHPIMLQSIDGPGTIPIIARLASSKTDFRYFRTLGYNVAIHCFCDIACGGGKPITLLDNISNTDMHPGIIEAIVAGMADASQLTGCRLVGGELAQLRNVVVTGEYDFCACVTGLVEARKWINPQDNIRPGQLLVGFQAFCPNLNGLSAVRTIALEKLGMKITDIVPATDKSVVDTFIQPQPNYSSIIMQQLENEQPVIAASHITGGGLIDNVERNLPDDCQVVYNNNWPVPPVYKWLKKEGNVDDMEANRTWNMGIGFIQFVPDARSAEALIEKVKELLGIEAYKVGVVETRKQDCQILFNCGTFE